MQRAADVVDIVIGFPGRTKVRLSDNFRQRRARAIQIDVRKAIDIRQSFVNILAGVFFEMQARDLHGHRPPVVRVAGFVAIGGHDLKGAVCRKRLIVLRDLIALGQVGIKIILAREDRSLVDVQSQRQRCARAEFDRAPIQHRQRARQTETHGTRVRVGRVAKMRRAAAKDFRRSVQLRMDLEADDGFPGVHSFRFQVTGSCPHSYASTRRMGSFDNKT